MTKLLAAFACAFATTGMAQVGSYLGPGIMSNGAANIGDRSGAAVDLRFFADVTGVYDTGLAPFQVNSKGELVTVSGLYGEQVDGGLYGTHTWRDSVLGIDLSGNYFHYDNASSYDGSTVNLMLGYTWQKSRHVVFDFRQVGGTTTFPYGFGYISPVTVLANEPTSLLFNNRMYYIQSSADMTYIQSSRLSYTIGGDGFWIRREASGLAGTDGWTARGSIRYRLSKTRTLGITYSHLFFDFPPSFGQSSSDMMQGYFATSLGKRWTLNIGGGAFRSNVIGIQEVSINPVIAALLGTSVGYQAFNRTDIFPTGQVNMSARLKNSSLSFGYSETVVPGNGVYLTSRQDSGFGSFSYTGIHKWNLGLSGGYYKLETIGQGIQPYSGFSGGGGFTYGLSRAFHIVGRYDYRRQEIAYANGYRNNSYRVTLGLAFSPGDVPLSLW